MKNKHTSTFSPIILHIKNKIRKHVERKLCKWLQRILKYSRFKITIWLVFLTPVKEMKSGIFRSSRKRSLIATQYCYSNHLSFHLVEWCYFTQWICKIHNNHQVQSISNLTQISYHFCTSCVLSVPNFQ